MAAGNGQSTAPPPSAPSPPESAESAAPALSVVIATYNRLAPLQRLLGQLADQTLAPASFEVIVVDDGSTVAVSPELAALGVPFPLRVVSQANGGAAAARHAGALQARADLLLFLDDDMGLPPHFLAAHLAQHQAPGRVVLGHIRPAQDQESTPLFARYHAGKIDRLGQELATGQQRPRGVHLYTGNVSLPRADYFRVGGLDPSLRRSEDVELGARLERAGLEFVFASAAFSIHESDHADLEAWRRQSRLYGEVGLRIAHKHPRESELHPYHFLRSVHPLSVPLLASALLAPAVGDRLARSGFAAARLLDHLRLGAPAVKATALVHGLDYFSGVGHASGGLGGVAGEGLRYLAGRWAEAGAASDVRHWLAIALQDLEADHAIALESRPSYSDRHGLGLDLAHRIGLQMMAAYRLMQAFRRAERLLEAKVVSRLIRHLYGADLHWDAELAAGVHIVHGMGMALSGKARVGAGCVLSHQVTLGEGITPSTRRSGAPTVEERVHLGPGATLLGPITIGRNSKIMPGALVLESVPPDSIVEVVPAQARPRQPRPEPAATPFSAGRPTSEPRGAV